MKNPNDFIAQQVQILLEADRAGADGAKYVSAACFWYAKQVGMDALSLAKVVMTVAQEMLLEASDER